MAIVQISKIIHRTGANIDLPQLDTGEIGFATDTQRVFIGNDPEIVPPANISATTQTEILTDKSPLDFSRLNGSSNTTLSIDSLQVGQILVIDNTSEGNVVKNYDGNLLSSNTKVNLGSASNVKISGGTNGYVLQTDGTGNLTWVNNGIVTAGIANVSRANPAVVTTKSVHQFGVGTMVFISNVAGMTQLDTGGVSGTNQYYAKRLTDTTFSLYSDAGLTTTVNSLLFFPATANTGNAYAMITPSGSTVAGGANSQVQFNDGGSTLNGNTGFTFDKTTGLLTVSGNINVGHLNGNSHGNFNGVIGATTPNTATFSTATVVNTLTTANIATSNITTTGNAVLPTTYSDNVHIRYNSGMDNWRIFANVDGIFVTDSDSGNTYQVNLTQV